MSKKLVSIALTASTILWAAGVASLPLANAQSTTDLQAQIASLLAQIQQLQSQLGTTGGSTSTMTSGSCYAFTSDLTVGSTGAAVTALQQMLISKGYLTAVSAPTGYFGSLTQAAVAAWQAANGITPSAGYFGPKSRAFYASTCVSTGTTGTGTTGTTGTGTTGVAVPSTGLSVSLASDNPTAGSLITSNSTCGAGSTGAARVPVLAVNLTASNSGAVTVTGMNFHKTGVLADSAIGGAYLIQNGQVVAQYNSISNGVISFSGMDLSVPAGQTAEYQLAIDVSAGLSAGNTTGFSLNAASDVTAFDTTNTAVTPSGVFPLNGNTFTVTSVSNPCLASLQITSSSIGTTVTAGTQGNIVGAFNFQVGNNPVWLKSIAFHVIGSANMTNLQNVKLLVNGTQAGATLSSVGSNDIAYFNMTSAPVQLNTGSNNIQIQSDVTGSPSFNFTWEVLNGYDVLANDSQYNVPVAVTLTSGVDSTVKIQAGQTTTSQDSSTPTGNIAKGVSQTTLAKFDVYASGEPTKVKFLGFDLVFTGVQNTGAISTLVKNINIT
ncbi:MAG TPA: peptidoglycan-binding protein, partial [Candidatus Paceibacterota bacterium]|nr:peptidoglycan-binding protein [Candidatus Paceibacterota bacterium]